MNVSRSVNQPCIGVVIPCYRVRQQIISVLGKIGPEVSCIIVVDDKCPEETGAFVERSCRDPRVSVVYHQHNRGVGGAVLTGYRKAIELGASVIVKLDGDDQMDPSLISHFVGPIIEGEADYTKGNRFFDLESLRGMPPLRLIGNVALSFISKLSSGYWKIMDPTNGYTAIDARVAAILPHSKIAARYFFESDMLFRLNTIQAVVQDIPMDACYGDEKSNLRIRKVLFEFPGLHLSRFVKRIFYTYFLRDFNPATLQLLAGAGLGLSGLIYGLTQWMYYGSRGIGAPTGTVVLATLQIILGVQFLLSWITYDVNSNNTKPIAGRLRGAKAISLARTPANSPDAFADGEPRVGNE